MSIFKRKIKGDRVVTAEYALALLTRPAGVETQSPYRGVHKRR